MNFISAKSIALTCCLMMFFHGCAIIVSQTENRAEIDIEKVKKSKLISMDKKQLFQNFGPPLAIARHNGPPLYIPSKPQVSSHLKKEPETLEPLSAFEKFSKKHIVNENHVIYLYVGSTVSGYGLYVSGNYGPVRTMSVSLKSYRVWILIDGRNEKILDYVIEELE